MKLCQNQSFWNDQDSAQKVISESKALKDVVGDYTELTDEQENLEMTLELLREEFDAEMQEELGADLKAFKVESGSIRIANAVKR